MHHRQKPLEFDHKVLVVAWYVEGNHKNLQEGQVVPCLRFKPGTSGIQVRHAVKSSRTISYESRGYRPTLWRLFLPSSSGLI
jgi:hypothetical protein